MVRMKIVDTYKNQLGNLANKSHDKPALLNFAEHVSNDQNQNESIFCLSLHMFYLMKVSFEGNSFFSGSTWYFEEMFYSFS